MLIPTKIQEELNHKIVEVAEKYLLEHTIQFFKKTENGMRPFACGILALIHKTHFIFTASHVVEYLDENELFFRISPTGYIRVFGEVIQTDEKSGLDLAYIRPTPEIISYLVSLYLFLPLIKHEQPSYGRDLTHYAIVGFPERNIANDGGILRTDAELYLTSAMNDKPYVYYNLDKSKYLILEMNGKATDIVSNEKLKVSSLFNLTGISGCGVWLLEYNLNPDTNEVGVNYSLVGIMTDFRDGKYYCLIANKINLLMDALYVIEKFI